MEETAGRQAPASATPCALGCTPDRAPDDPTVVSVARIVPNLAGRSWARVRRLLGGDDLGGASEDLRCFIAVFGHADGVAESIDRVRRVLAAGTPAHASGDVAVQAALSSEPDREEPGTLYMNWLFELGTPDELVEDIYMHTLPLAIFRRDPERPEGAGDLTSRR